MSHNQKGRTIMTTRGLQFLGALVLGLALVSLTAPTAARAEQVGRRFYSPVVNATQTNTTTTFATGTISLSVYNAGPNAAYIAINAAATTSSQKIPVGIPVNLGMFLAESMGVICATGETAAVQIFYTTQ